MPAYQAAVENLVAQLTRLPGVGTRTAQRLAFHLMRTQKDEALQLAHAIEVVKERVRFCRECGNWTEDEARAENSPIVRQLRELYARGMAEFQERRQAEQQGS